MAVLDDFDYDEYNVFASLPRVIGQPTRTVSMAEVINAGLVAMGYDVDDALEVNWIDSHNY